MKNLFKALGLVLTLSLLLVLVACGPKDLEAATAKMKENGYTVLVSDQYDEAGNNGEIAYLSVSKNAIASVFTDDVDASYLTARLFASSADAKAYYNRVKGDSSENHPYALVGNWVVDGTADAIKIFKK